MPNPTVGTHRFGAWWWMIWSYRALRLLLRDAEDLGLTCCFTFFATADKSALPEPPRFTLQECVGRWVLMKTYTNKSFTGHWPVGTAAVVRAINAEEAATILNEELVRLGLPGDATAGDMMPLLRKERVRILCDGDY